MKPSLTRRYRRRAKPAKQEGAFFKKEGSQAEHGFFGEASHDAFFQPAFAPAPSPGVQRKCDQCEQEDKKAHRMTDKKEEDKKLQRAADKKEEDDKKLQRATDKKEEDKKLQRAEDKKEEDKKLQKKEASPSSNTAKSVNGYVGSLNSKGQPMPAPLNNFFSARMGYDFSHVKLHTGIDAAESAKSVNAKAYTIGNHIVFNEGQFNTSSVEGNKLLAHELTHIIQNDEAAEQQVQRKETSDPLEETDIMPTAGMGTGTKTQNTTHYANCAGVSVQGHTDANYSNSFTHSGSSRPSGSCSGCAEGDNCVVNTGTIVSTFTANPTVTLPGVPPGLSDCEAQAVQTFINTTLRNHELKHVAAFNTYNGVVRTPYTFAGCASGLDDFVQARHDAIEVARRAAADAKSAALDPFNPTIPCNCPDPVPSTETGQND